MAPGLKRKYNGERVFKVIVDGGFTCPNRDGSKGYGGCTYCNVDSFTPIGIAQCAQPARAGDTGYGACPQG
jgi:radical SAM superfamily enzyme